VEFYVNKFVFVSDMLITMHIVNFGICLHTCTEFFQKIIMILCQFFVTVFTWVN